MAHSDETKAMEKALEDIKPLETTILESHMFAVLAEICQYRRLKEEKVTGPVLEKHLDRVFQLALGVATDWKYMIAMEEELSQADLRAKEAAVADESQRYRDQDNEADRIESGRSGEIQGDPALSEAYEDGVRAMYFGDDEGPTKIFGLTL